MFFLCIQLNWCVSLYWLLVCIFPFVLLLLLLTFMLRILACWNWLIYLYILLICLFYSNSVIVVSGFCFYQYMSCLTVDFALLSMILRRNLLYIVHCTLNILQKSLLRSIIMFLSKCIMLCIGCSIIVSKIRLGVVWSEGVIYANLDFYTNVSIASISLTLSWTFYSLSLLLSPLLFLLHFLTLFSAAIVVLSYSSINLAVATFPSYGTMLFDKWVTLVSMLDLSLCNFCSDSFNNVFLLFVAFPSPALHSPFKSSAAFVSACVCIFFTFSYSSCGLYGINNVLLFSLCD